MEQSNTCAACSAPVGAEELAQGFAVRVSGRLLCPLCLDRLPGDAKVMVNQMRALRGMAVTTYRYYSGRHPRLPLFTFTTANLVLAHRRKLVHGEDFAAPPLPPPGSRPRLPTASEAGRGDRSGWFAVLGVSILVVTGLVWLVLPTKTAKPIEPVHQPTVETPVLVPQTSDPQPRSDALILTELERRLREQPAQGRSIADEAELLRDRLPPRDVGLRNRADALIREAMAAADTHQPKPEPPPTDPTPAPLPAPVALPITPTTGPPPLVVPVPHLTPAKLKPVEVVKPVVPRPIAEPVTPPKSDPEVRPGNVGAIPCEAVVVWPKASKALIEPGALPRIRDVPWPWPTDEAVWSPAMDLKAKPTKHLAIELRLPGAAAPGGATIVIHPGKAERSSLSAIWTDGTASTPAQVLSIDGLRWQALAVPATGSEAFDQSQLRLRLEDIKDLGDQRPFLVAGASSRTDAPPTAADHPPRLPVLLPSAMADKANGWSTFRTALRKLADVQLKDRQFSFAKAKVMLPFPKSQGAIFRSTVREELSALLALESLPNGNPADLPYQDADFAKPAAGWPADGMDDLDRFPVLAFGWRCEAWGNDADLATRLEQLLGKMLTADRKLRRPAVVPVLIIGEIDRASSAEVPLIQQRWGLVAERVASLGIPVIDLRSAQTARDTATVQRNAARLLTDGLRQLDWLMKL